METRKQVARAVAQRRRLGALKEEQFAQSQIIVFQQHLGWTGKGTTSECNVYADQILSTETGPQVIQVARRKRIEQNRLEYNRATTKSQCNCLSQYKFVDFKKGVLLEIAE